MHLGYACVVPAAVKQVECLYHLHQNWCVGVWGLFVQLFGKFQSGPAGEWEALVLILQALDLSRGSGHS